ncbi:MAG TPA: hypothetical protein VF329_13770 [Gammaproteobacteria bacterium]
MEHEATVVLEHGLREAPRNRRRSSGDTFAMQLAQHYLEGRRDAPQESAPPPHPAAIESALQKPGWFGRR